MATKKKRDQGSNFVAQNLQWLINQERITQQFLADATGVGQPTINRILSGKNLHPRDETLHPLARHFDVTLEDLRFKNLSQSFGLPSTLRGIKIPMISSKIAGKQKIPADWPDKITVYRPVSPEAFAMDVCDDAMVPYLNKHDRVVIDPQLIPQPGNFVAARVNGEESAMVRRFKALEVTKAKRHFELLPQNDDFPRYSSRNAEPKIQVLGVCVERHESLID
jgi:SOS-response transcriptional repressor LexA